METPDILLQLASGPDSRSIGPGIEDSSSFDLHSAKSNILPAKASHVLSTSVTDPDIKDVLDAYNGSLLQNNADSRRQLRVQVFQDLANSNAAIISDFGLIAMYVEQIGVALTAMHGAFDDIVDRVDCAGLDISSTLQESDAMMVERLRINWKHAILENFLRKFTVSAADLNNIASSPHALNDDFFDTLARVKAIYSDCQILLGSESTRAGVEIMDQMTKHLNSAYQKVYLWLQRELKTLSFETPVGNHRIRKALDILTSRPTLLESCIATLAESRQRTLSEAFNTALTGGNDLSDSKPIDMMAHDPIRYIGDMLAWLHSTLVGELEALQAIFEITLSESEMNPSLVDGLDNVLESNIKLRDLAAPLADKSLEAVLSAFRLRTEQVISCHEDPILLYGMLNILNFYRETFRKVVGAESAVVASMEGLASAATRQLQSCLRDLVRAVQHDAPGVTEDLSPPKFMAEALTRFKDLIRSFDASLISDGDKPQAFDMVYSEALQPYIQGCQALSKDLPSPKSHIFIVNCIEVAKNTLRLSSYGTLNYLHLLDDIVSSHVNSIVLHLHDQFLEASGLSRIFQPAGNILQEPSHLELTTELIVECSQQLDMFLPSAIMDAESQLVYLSRPSLRKAIISSAIDKFVEDFTRTETWLHQLPDDQFSRDWFPRTTEEIKILLG